ncbi:MAG: CoA-binding protein [Acidobacteria bacterium]|jgi:hypothetical protein|nr:CoA-binding protein [Acidobacteriota bacterium]
MISKFDVDRFLSQKKLAVAGVSRKKIKVGNTVYFKLKEGGYDVFAINPNTESIDGDPCFPDIKSLPEPVTGIVTVVHPEQTLKIVKDAAAANISLIWMQPGSESEAAVQFCRENNMTVIKGECIFMYIEPVTSVHKFHRWLRKLFGRMPK